MNRMGYILDSHHTLFFSTFSSRSSFSPLFPPLSSLSPLFPLPISHLSPPSRYFYLTLFPFLLTPSRSFAPLYFSPFLITTSHIIYTLTSFCFSYFLFCSFITHTISSFPLRNPYSKLLVIINVEYELIIARMGLSKSSYTRQTYV